MRALSVVPKVADSIELEDVAEPQAGHGPVLVATKAIGICGTDLEIIDGAYGKAPPGAKRLILGHESIGVVDEAPPDCGLRVGDWVVGIVRHPDPVPCRNCAVGEWDMCRNDAFTEHGINGLNGYAADRYRASPEFLVKVDASLGLLGVLLEPTSVVAKAWEQTELIASRSHARNNRVLITGAGPIGLLAAMIGVQRGYDVHVLDQMETGLKPDVVRALGAQYRVGEVSGDWDFIFECTGVPALVAAAMQALAPTGILCLTGVSSPGKVVSVDMGAVNRELVLENQVVFGSVNANRRHYEQAGEALAKADQKWLSRLVTRKVPIERFAEAFERDANDIKVVLTF